MQEDQKFGSREIERSPEDFVGTTMTETTPAQELRAATDMLRKRLPAYLTASARPVQGDSERMDAVALCIVDHSDYPASALECCWVFEVGHDGLAEQVVALLNARESLAALLDWAAEQADMNPLLPPRRRLDLTTALTAARAINGRGR